MNNNEFNSNLSMKDKKGNKKSIVIILIIIIAIGIFFLLKMFKSNNEIANLNLIFDPNKPIMIIDNGKYGYISPKGKIMIEPQYNNATDFYGEYAVVVVNNPDSTSYKETIYQIIDKKGNVKLTSDSYFEPEYYPDYGVWVVDDILYNSKLERILSEGIEVEYIDYEYFQYTDSEKNESGIMTYTGKKIFTTPDTSISVNISPNEYNEEDLYATVKTYGDSEKEVIISLKTGDILFTSENVEIYNIYEEDDGIFYYYNDTLDDGDENGKYLFFIDNKLAYQTTDSVDEIEIYDYENQILEIDYGYNYDELGKTQRRYYYDVKNKKMLDEEPSLSITDLEIDLLEQIYGFKEYYSSGKYGLMSGEKIIIPCEYDSIEYLDIKLFNYMKSKGKELILLEKDETTLLYNLKKSKIITNFDSNDIWDYYDSTFIVVNLNSENTYMIYNLLSDKSMMFNKNDDISIGSNYVAVKKDGKITYYNTDLKQIYVSTDA